MKWGSMLSHLKPLISQSLTRVYSPGSTILFQGEVPRSVGIITRGIIRVYSISAQGDEQIITYNVAGEFFPASWIFGKTPGALFFYESVSESEIAFINRQEFLTYMTGSSERMRALLDYFATNYAASLIRVSALEQPKAREKLLYTLYYLCQRYGNKTPKSSSIIEIELLLTHQNLASLVGLTRETTATEMNKLKREKIINYDNQKYRINLDKLLDLLGEDSFRGISINSPLSSGSSE